MIADVVLFRKVGSQRASYVIRQRQLQFTGSGADWNVFLAVDALLPAPYLGGSLRVERLVRTGAWDVVGKVFKNEGLAGFYKGLAPNIVRVLPSTCVTFLVYENMKFYLPRFWAGEGPVDA